MNNAHHPTDEEIFAEALQQPTPEAREAYLKDAVATDEARYHRITALLKAHHNAGEFLGSPPAAVSAETRPTTTGPVAVSEKPGDRIARYKLLQQIGEGGCGVVYMAEQEEPVKRRVALKVIKLGMDTKEVIARFEAERQALALMDHPNIAKVLDAGATQNGRPYFVMELVRGVAITRYCDENKLDTTQRLELFVQVCQAIQHAHQKGIIHRDIKPSNILVSDHDGVGVPKIIDFGIAKATAGQTLTDKTVFTAFEQFIGTPAYMSPEQAKMSGLDIDTRSDIYSLGVLLYELLAGKTPFAAERLDPLRVAIEQIRRIISDEEPPRPSTRLSTLDADEQSSIANRRRSESPRLINLVRGDLDWIVMKCLEKDRTRRYETANGLASDIERHLNTEPVIARPPSRLYRLQKMVRRNRLVFTAAGAFAGVLLFGLGLVTWLLVKEKQARREVETARQKAVAAEEVQKNLRQESDIAKSNALVMKLEADQQRQRAETEATNAFHMKLVAEQQARNSEARRLLTEANHVMNDQPQEGLLLLVEAMNVHTRNREQPFLAVEEALLTALTNTAGLALGGDGTPITSVATGPDGRWLAAGGWNGSIRLWDLQSLETGLAARALPGHTNGISAISFSPNGRWLISVAWDGTLGLCEFQAGTVRQSSQKLAGHQAGINAIVISKQSRWLATAGEDGASKIWDLQTSDIPSSVRTLNYDHGAVNAVGITSDEHWLITGSEDGTVGISDLHTPDMKNGMKLLAGHSGPINAISISPDDRQLATASEDGTARLWSLSAEGNGECTRVLRGHEGGVDNILYSPDGKRLVTGGWDGTARVWSPQTGAETETPEVMSAQEKGWRFPGARTSKLKMTDLRNSAALERDVRDFARNREKVATLALLLEQNLLPSSMRPEPPTNFHIVSATTDGQPPPVPNLAAGGVTAMAISANSRWLLTAGSDGILQRWDLTSGSVAGSRRALRGHQAWISGVAAAPGDAYFASASWDGTIRLWPQSNVGRSFSALEAHMDHLNRVISIKRISYVVNAPGEKSEDKQLAQDLVDLARDVCARNLTPREWDKHFVGQPYRKTFEDLPEPSGDE